MQRLKIIGGKKLSGEISVHGAKNAALPLLAACVLAKGETVLHNCPRLSDSYAALRILSCLGCNCKREEDTAVINTDGLTGFDVPDNLMREMRSSIVFLGAILGRCGKCKLSFPGGCELGPRPIDLHIKALRSLGAVIKEEYGLLDCEVSGRLRGNRISLSFPSVGATENIILAATTARGETVIENAAREPEITDLANFLNKCGAKISGAGTSKVVVAGVDELYGCEYSVMPDRIVACTYMSAAAVTGSELNIKKVNFHDLTSVIPIFEEMGCTVFPFKDNIYINAKKRLNAVKTIRTMPYPGFPTDAQAILMTPLCKAAGTSVIVENIFESRYRHVDELCRMGAKIKTEGRVAVVDGVKTLYGAGVMSTDLRGGAALVLAGLGAQGETVIGNVKYIDRGYENIERDISSVGGDIVRI